MICFTVEGEPVAKGRARVTTKGGFARAYTPAKTVEYEKVVAMAGKIAMAGRKPLEGPLVMGLSIYRSIPKSWGKKDRQLAIQGDIYPVSKPDSDNVCKGVSDALNGVAYVDDSQIVDHIISKRYSEFPRIVVRISRVGAENKEQ